MQLKSKKTNKAALITSVAVVALTTTALTLPTDARSRLGKLRHPVTTAANNTAIDDRYAHVQGGVTPTEQRPSRRAARRTITQNTAMNGMSFGSSGLVDQARRYVGTNPTGRSSLWCARFLNMVLERSGRSGTGSDMASSFSSFGNRVAGPQIGAIAVMSRGKRGGHVGIVSGIDESGNPILISGNNNGRVAEAPYPRGRIYAYVMP